MLDHFFNKLKPKLGQHLKRSKHLNCNLQLKKTDKTFLNFNPKPCWSICLLFFIVPIIFPIK